MLSSSSRGGALVHLLFRVDRQHEQFAAADAGLEADAEFFVVVEAVDHLDEGPQLARGLLHLDHLGVLQNVPPLPVGVV